MRNKFRLETACRFIGAVPISVTKLPENVHIFIFYFFLFLFFFSAHVSATRYHPSVIYLMLIHSERHHQTFQ